MPRQPSSSNLLLIENLEQIVESPTPYCSKIIAVDQYTGEQAKYFADASKLYLQSGGSHQYGALDILGHVSIRKTRVVYPEKKLPRNVVYLPLPKRDQDAWFFATDEEAPVHFAANGDVDSEYRNELVAIAANKGVLLTEFLLDKLFNGLDRRNQRILNQIRMARRS